MTVRPFALEERRSVRFAFGYCNVTSFDEDTRFLDVREEHRIFLVLHAGSRVGTVRDDVRKDAGIPLALHALVLIPALVRLSMDFPKGLEVLAFHFAATDALESPLFPFRGPLLARDDGPRWAASFGPLLASKKSEGSEALRSLAVSLVWHFAADAGDDGLREDRVVTRFPEFFRRLDATPPAAVKISRLAPCDGRSAEALAKAFQRASGRSLKDFLLERTTGALERALLLGGKSLREIADDLGFPSEAALSKFFHARKGVSPGAWRKANRKAPFT